MRTREFVMKDLYSFSRNEQEFREFYEVAAAAYMKILRAWASAIPHSALLLRGSFSKFSDEFQTV